MHSGKHVDLLIPGEVTFDRLRRLLHEAFAAKGVALPDGFTLALGDKSIAVGDHDLVASSGVADGDRIHIVTNR
jgi:uncharacterized ubiquitin-like protein YukD